MKIRSLSVSLALLATLATCSSQAYAEEAYCAPVGVIMDDLKGYEPVTVASTQEGGVISTWVGFEDKWALVVWPLASSTVCVVAWGDDFQLVPNL